MKLKLDRSILIKIGCLLLLLAVAPFAIEFLILADFVGVEFAVTFMLLYFKTAYIELVERWWRFKAEFEEFIYQLSLLLMFQPRAYAVTSSAACLVLMLTGSMLVTCGLWLPVMALSTGTAM